MKIELIGKTFVVMDNPDSLHNYFAWPSVTRLQNGKIAAVASGYRVQHICAFGKAVISYSEDEGETFTRPAPVIDTPLDDRDAGILPFGEKNVVMTSFNNSRRFQRKEWWGVPQEYKNAYLDLVTDEQEEKYLAATFRFSRDCGVTWEKEIHHSPVTSPHGPLVTKDGRLIWVGRAFSSPECEPEEAGIFAYAMNGETGEMTKLGKIPPCEPGTNTLDCEPHAIELPDGRLLCHIRVQWDKDSERVLMSTYQTESSDGGRTWTQPRRILSTYGGYPAHLLMHSSGALITAYGVRRGAYAIRAAVSYDLGATWQTDLSIWEDGPNDDLGYPSTVELADGSLLTVFYGHFREEDPCIILGQKWRISPE